MSGNMHTRVGHTVENLSSIHPHTAHHHRHQLCTGSECGHPHHHDHGVDDEDEDDAHLEHMYDFVDDDAGVDLDTERLSEAHRMPSPGLPADEHLHRLVHTHHTHRHHGPGANVIGISNTTSALPPTGPMYKSGQMQRHAHHDGHTHAHHHRYHHAHGGNYGGHAHAPPSAASTVAGKDLETMSTFFVEQLRLKDPVKSALAFHDQGIVSLKAWVSKSDEERSRVVNVLKQVGVVAGDRSKLRKVTFDQISEWTRSKANPPLPSVLPHQRQSKEDMEVILASGANEYLISRDLVGLGLRGIYGGAMELFASRVPGPRAEAAGEGADSATSADTESPAADASDERDLHDVKIQAMIYRMCALRPDERKMLHHLLAHIAPASDADGGADEADRAAYTERLVTLDREEAMLGGARKCLSNSCDAIESSDKKFEICSRCKIAGYCSRTCQKADWKSHSKLCFAPPDTRTPAR